MKIKTYYKDYSLATGALSRENEIGDVMNERQDQYMLTAEYKTAYSEASALVQALSAKLPKGDEDLRLLRDSIYNLEWLCFRAGYKAGIRDLVTAMTFNEAGLTKTAFVDLEGTMKSAITG